MHSRVDSIYKIKNKSEPVKSLSGKYKNTDEWIFRLLVVGKRKKKKRVGSRQPFDQTAHLYASATTTAPAWCALDAHLNPLSLVLPRSL